MNFHNLETVVHICGNWNCNLQLYESDFFHSWITGSQFWFPLSGISWLRFETSDTACWLFQISTRLFRDMWVCFVAKHQLTFSNSWTGIMKIQLWVSFVAIHQLTFSNSWTCIMKIQLWRLHWVLVAIVIWTFLCRELHFRESHICKTFTDLKLKTITKPNLT